MPFTNKCISIFVNRHDVKHSKLITRNNGLKIPLQDYFNSIAVIIYYISNIFSINGMLEQIRSFKLTVFNIIHRETFNSYITNASCAAIL